MASTPPHSRLLADVGREVLRPLGLTQKGRSRVWLDDRGWWVCVVEFQPSSWSRGSYLNVGAMWLWRESEDIYFAVGYRVTEAPFVELESEAQFAPAARRLAGIAARKVIDYRGLFPELASAARYLDQQTRRHGEPNDAFDAGSPGGSSEIAGKRSAPSTGTTRSSRPIWRAGRAWTGSGQTRRTIEPRLKTITPSRSGSGRSLTIQVPSDARSARSSRPTTARSSFRRSEKPSTAHRSGSLTR